MRALFRLCLASHLACSHIWPVSGFFLGQLEGFGEVGRTYYGLASLPSFSPPLELHYPEFLRGQRGHSLHTSGWETLLTTARGNCGLRAQCSWWHLLSKCKLETVCSSSAWGPPIAYLTSPLRFLDPREFLLGGCRAKVHLL